MRKYLHITCILFLCIFLAGCGKNILETGNVSTEQNVLLEGRFDYTIIDTSYLPGYYKIVNSFAASDYYFYILSYYNSSISTSEYCYVKFDKSGNTLYSGSLDLPISISNHVVSFSDMCKDISISRSTLPVFENGYVNYVLFEFADDGSFSAVCEVGGSAYSESMGADYSVYNKYFVNWDSNGTCISIDDYSGPVFGEYSEQEIISDSNGNRYSISYSGLSNVDADGGFVSKYFDFINSDIASMGFVSVNIIDSYSFSGVYRNLNNEYVLACFNLNSKPPKGDALVLASNGLTNEQKDYIVSFNKEDNGVRISVSDYRDRLISGDAEEAWGVLRDDLLSGYSPDMVLNNSGYDVYLEQKLCENSLLVNLQDALKNDEDLENFVLNDKAISLFYSNEDIYTIVPSYSYNTVVGSTRDFSGNENMSSNAFVDLNESMISSSVIFPDDTRDEFIKRVLFFNGNRYIDYSSGSSFFSNNDFIDYLILSSKLPPDYESAFEFYGLQDDPGKALMFEVECNSIGDMILDSIISCKGDYVELGFPQGEISCGAFEASCSYMIFSGRKYTNNCWDFIKLFLLSDYQDELTNGIPVTASGYNAWLSRNYATASNPMSYMYIYNDEVFTVTDLPQEDAEMLINNINNTNTIAFSDYNIENIVLDYSQKFYDGQITGEEAAQMIDNDIEAYLNSN